MNIRMTFLQMYWETAKSSKGPWEECEYAGHRLVLATFTWPPKEIPFGDARQTRHIVFVIDASEDTPSRSLSYEPASPGPGVFLGEVSPENLRINHGKIPVMTREEFWAFAFAKLFGSSPPPELSPRPLNSSNAWWKLWK